jgi:aryl-alcohol dehydrogenase-like predicted oxidoreductase
VDALDLYYVHMPPSAQIIEDLMDYMAEAVDAKKIRSVGVSNFDVTQMEKAADRLDDHGLKLAANQVEYSLLHRDPEENGVLEACKTLNASLVAYRPLSRGRLTSAKMSGYSMAAGSSSVSESPLFNVLMSIAQAHEGSVSQVALNWLLGKDELVVPIPGVTKVNHALGNVRALEWEMSRSESEELDTASTIP